MTEKQSNPNRDRADWSFDHGVDRRTFLAAGGGVSATLLAGCSSDSGSESADGDSDDGDTDDSTGTFRLLISDMPADIGDFDRLDVTLDSARIFDGEAEDAKEEEQEGDDANEEDERDEEEVDDEKEEEDDTADGEEEESDTEKDDTEDADDEKAEKENENENEKEDDEEERGFYVVDLEGATVDLTQVVGDKAMPVGELDLSEGTYQKIELHVADVEGIVDGAEATVKVPSEKLQLTKPFEVRAGESVDFVFDINVVKRGQGNDYNLTPVISKSGVKGEDVEVEEVPEGGESEAEDGDEEAADETDGDDEGDQDDEDNEDEEDKETDEGGEGDEKGNESETGDGENEETDGT